jgi:DNA (cytosine-5)-methyltransferase 1
MSHRGTYYNEWDPYPAAWIRNLVSAGHLPAGTVDERSVRDVSPDDVRGYRQCHFFAGIGGWPLALRLAGWRDGWPAWTGSCPCQPFSNAGARRGFADERHLWPSWFELVRACRPPVVFGEQVASPDGLRWLDAVQDDVEGEGYSLWAADLCAAGVGAPHIRQRIYFVAYLSGGVEHAFRDGVRQHPGELPGHEGQHDLGSEDGHHPPVPAGPAGPVDDADEYGLPGARGSGGGRQDGESPHGQVPGHPGPWDDPEWVACSDGRARPVEPGVCPLADGFPSRVGRVRAYGNSIVPQVAARFARFFVEEVMLGQRGVR